MPNLNGIAHLAAWPEKGERRADTTLPSVQIESIHIRDREERGKPPTSYLL
jgi:hypothetical protein